MTTYYWTELKIGAKEITKSADQGDKMRKLPNKNSKVSRRLFEAGPEDNTALDNFANILQESCRIDKDNMKKKWNFDFDKEAPLDGPYEWYRKDEDSWIGMKPIAETVLEDKFVPIEKENQMTPKVTTVEMPPVVRKRKRDTILSDIRAKRVINFE